MSVGFKETKVKDEFNHCDSVGNIDGENCTQSTANTLVVVACIGRQLKRCCTIERAVTVNDPVLTTNTRDK